MYSYKHKYKLKNIYLSFILDSTITAEGLEYQPSDRLEFVKELEKLLLSDVTTSE